MLCGGHIMNDAVTHNRACHPGGGYWNYCLGALSLSQVTEILLKNGHMQMKSACAQSLNELQWHDYMTVYLDSSPNNGCRAMGCILTHWGRVTHICVGKLTNIGSDNGLSPGRRQAIIWTNARILSIGPLGTNLSEISIEIHTFSIKKMSLKMSSAKWRLFRLGLNVLTLYMLTFSEGTKTYIYILCHYSALIWHK